MHIQNGFIYMNIVLLLFHCLTACVRSFNASFVIPVHISVTVYKNVWLECTWLKLLEIVFIKVIHPKFNPSIPRYSYSWSEIGLSYLTSGSKGLIRDKQIHGQFTYWYHTSPKLRKICITNFQDIDSLFCMQKVLI